MSKLIHEPTMLDVALLYSKPERNVVRLYEGMGKLDLPVAEYLTKYNSDEKQDELVRSMLRHGWDVQQQAVDGQPFTAAERTEVHTILKAEWEALSTAARDAAKDSPEAAALAAFERFHVRGGKLVAERWVNSGNRRYKALKVATAVRYLEAVKANKPLHVKDLLSVRYVDKPFSASNEVDRVADLSYRNEFRSEGSREMGTRDRLNVANILFAADWSEGKIGEVIKRGAAQKLVPFLKLDRKFKSLRLFDRALISPSDKERKAERIDLTPIVAAELRKRFFTEGTAGKPSQVRSDVTAEAVEAYVTNPTASPTGTPVKAMATADIAKLAEASAATVVADILTGVTANDKSSIAAVTKAAVILNLAYSIAKLGSPAAVAEAVKGLKAVCAKYKLPEAIEAGQASVEAEAEAVKPEAVKGKGKGKGRQARKAAKA